MISNYEQYKLAVDAAEKVTDRRYEFNKFFITILTLLITAIGLFFKDPSSKYLFSIILLFLGIRACSIWKKQLQYFKKLIEIKYDTVKEMEIEFNIRQTHKMQFEKIEDYKSQDRLKSFTDQEKEMATLFQKGFIAYFIVILILFLNKLDILSILSSIVYYIKQL